MILPCFSLCRFLASARVTVGTGSVLRHTRYSRIGLLPKAGCQ